jgi:hypothetical protein
MLLKIHVPQTSDFEKVFAELFYQHLREHALLSVEPLRGEQELELVYSLEFKPRVDRAAFLTEVRRLAQGGRVTLLTGQENIDV